jgi:type I restriction enzyme R subunit
VLHEANNLDEFRQLWIETQKRKQLIDFLLGDNFSPELLRELENMSDFDMYDIFAHHGYHAHALNRPARNQAYLTANQTWFDTVHPKASIVLRGIGHQFEIGGTEALETPTLWEVPEIKMVGGLVALKAIGKPADVMLDAKGRLFAA